MNRSIESLLDALDAAAQAAPLLSGEALGDRTASLLAIWFIDRASPVAETSSGTLASIRDLHRREAAGESVPDGEWLSCRRTAIGYADDTDREVPKAGAFVEAAAWSLRSGGSNLIDLYMLLAPILQHRAIVATGWTTEDETRAMDLLNELVSAGHERSTIPSLFAQVDPMLERRFVLQLEASNRVSSTFRGEVIDALLATASLITP